MKVVCLQSSPHMTGNTATALEWLMDETRAAGHDVERFDLANMQIAPCRGCFMCQRDPSVLECAMKDEGLTLLGKMAAADAVIYATPLYCWSFTAQAQLLLDRHLCLVTGFTDPATKASHVSGKRAALLATCGGPKGEGNTDTLSTIFERLADFCDYQFAGELILDLCTSPNALGAEHERVVREFARGLLA